MKYLCLIYQNDETSARNAQQGVPMSQEYFAFTQEIQKSGHMLGGNALQPANTATTVRVRSGKVSTTDGPFAETKEQLGGYYLVEAADLNDAIQVAARIPGAKTGSIEVRPVRVFGDQPS